MSHITTARLRVQDIAAMQVAAQALGLTMRKGASYRSYYGQTQGVEHVISVPGNAKAYEIGLEKAKDGKGWTLKYDSWGDGGKALQDKAGQGLSRLNQEYAAAVITAKSAALARQGFVAHREMLGNGRLRMRLVQR